MRAQIIAVGTELLLGDIVNTNAQYLAKELALLGIDVFHQSVVGDNEERVLEEFDRAFSKCDIVITTGGLGPTKDDLTKEMAAKYFGQKLVSHEESLKEIKEYFKKLGKDLSKDNEKQAYFPKDCIVLKNECGTAPGAIMKKGDKRIIILPGPPKEMKTMFDKYAKIHLEKLTDSIIKSKVLRVFGMGESYMAEQVGDIIENSKNPTVAPYAKEIDVTLRITAKGKSEEECDKLIEPIEEKIKGRLGENVYGEGETTLEKVIGEILCKKNLTIATAESCTGGMIASKLIGYPGISQVFMQGAVTYSNEAKMKELSVNKETLDKFGAVSEETAKEMAEGIAKKAGVDISIVSTGIAGPGGGTEEKPVGLVYIGLYIKGNIIVKRFNFQGDREKIRIRSTQNALDMLRRELIKL